MRSLLTATERKLREAFRDIIQGRVVKRSRHELHWEGLDVSQVFIEELKSAGYIPTTVDAVDVAPGQRVAAFYVENTSAYFGWIFWEKFWAKRMRKLWGSVIRNAKGDWAIQITPRRRKTIYANMDEKFEMDLDRPSDF